jgi:hypothetical protein
MNNWNNIDALALQADSIVPLKRRDALTPYDKHLKNFNHTAALNAAMHVRINSIHSVT